MRYEHILQIYWTKGFFYSGNLFYFDKTLYELTKLFTGLGKLFIKRLIERFELSYIMLTPNLLLSDTSNLNSRILIKPLNIILSQTNSVNNNINELKRLNIIRLYLIKSYRGRCHALGKPTNGQRTWSNAWSSYNVNKELRSYISETKLQIQSKSKNEKINYKIIKKKYTNLKKSKTKVLKKKKTLWF